MTRPKLLAFAALLFLGPAAFANIYGAIRGVVHDPQHRPIQDAMVMLKAKSSDWAKSVTTDATGEFQINAVPLGDYSVSIASQGFAQTSQDVTVISGSVPVVHFLLKVATANANVTVSGAPEVAPTDSATPTTLVSRLDIERTPGADRTNSLAMITDNVPGAYVTHDQLHIRGGHQTSWLVDGVPVPNTNIASNIGPQFDPKDIDYMEVNRGSYGAEFGDRTYGVFNVVGATPSASHTTSASMAIVAIWAYSRPFPKSCTTRPMAMGVSDRSSSTSILLISFAWSRRCVRITTRFPTTRTLTIWRVPTLTAAAFATATVKLTP